MTQETGQILLVSIYLLLLLLSCSTSILFCFIAEAVDLKKVLTQQCGVKVAQVTSSTLWRHLHSGKGKFEALLFPVSNLKLSLKKGRVLQVLQIALYVSSGFGSEIFCWWNLNTSIPRYF